MKLSRIIAIFVLSMTMFVSCDESESVVTAVDGGLVEVNNLSLNYIVGNRGPYSGSLTIYQGEVKTTSVDIFKTFYTEVPDTAAEDSTATMVIASNTVKYETITAAELNKNNYVSFNFTFDELIDGLSLNGETLSNNDGDYQIGDYWEFEFYASTNTNRTVQQNKTTKVTVATRFAGKYRAVDAVYGRNTSASGIEWFYTESDWPAETVIESVDAITYRVLEYMGPFDGNEWYFQVDPVTLAITYPDEWKGVAQTGNNNPFITCATNQADFTAMGDPRLDCGSTSNRVVLDDVNGKDRLYMIYGYYTAGSGPRTFYHELEKIVE